ncbi:MAG: hypothetical protein N2Z79_02670 [Candidatus Omnitrophica bacterium]|nr:hypothetical protein [Candidatus Omnitrophota bacterium]
MLDIKELSTRINRSFVDAEKTEDSGSYQRLATIFSEFEARLREYIQHNTKDEIMRIIQKLEIEGEITKEELRFIKLWIVGDAEYYIKLENNFNEWLLEVKRIIDEINKISNQKLDLEAALSLRALIEDGKRVIYDIAFYLEKKERIKNFEEAVLELDKEEKDMLVRLIKHKLISPEF